MTKPVSDNYVEINGHKIHTVTTRNNTWIWGSKFAVPILRVLFRQGHSNQYVTNYLLTRYGQKPGMNLRYFQYQVSHHKRFSQTPDKIWKPYLLLKDNRLDNKGKYKVGETCNSYDAEVKRSLRSLRRLDPKVVERSSIKLPEGWALKYVFDGEQTYRAWCPPYAENQERLMQIYADV